MLVCSLLRHFAAPAHNRPNNLETSSSLKHNLLKIAMIVISCQTASYDCRSVGRSLLARHLRHFATPEAASSANRHSHAAALLVPTKPAAIVPLATVFCSASERMLPVECFSKCR